MSNQGRIFVYHKCRDRKSCWGFPISLQPLPGVSFEHRHSSLAAAALELLRNSSILSPLRTYVPTPLSEFGDSHLHFDPAGDVWHACRIVLNGFTLAAEAGHLGFSFWGPLSTNLPVMVCTHVPLFLSEDCVSYVCVILVCERSAVFV